MKQLLRQWEVELDIKYSIEDKVMAAWCVLASVAALKLQQQDSTKNISRQT